MVDVEPASSEAELVNREIDKRIPEGEPDYKKPHDEEALSNQINAEKPEDDERKDRLGLHRAPPNLETNYWTHFPVDDKETAMAETPVERDPQKDHEYPFGDAQLIYAFYSNDKRTMLKFFLRMPDDKVSDHQIDKNPIHEAAWHWIHRTFTESQLSENTQREINKITRFREKEEEEMKERERKGRQEELFQAKLSAFEIPAVTNSKHRELKSNIRKAKTTMEVNATVGAIIALEYLDGKAQ